MTITRRQFLINSGIAAVVLSAPTIIKASKDKIVNNYNDWKLNGFTSEDANNLDQYNISDIVPYLLTMMVFAYSFNLYDSLYDFLILISIIFSASLLIF